MQTCSNLPGHHEHCFSAENMITAGEKVDKVMSPVFVSSLFTLEMGIRQTPTAQCHYCYCSILGSLYFRSVVRLP